MSKKDFKRVLPNLRYFAIFDPKLSFDEKETLLDELLEEDRKRSSLTGVKRQSARY